MSTFVMAEGFFEDKDESRAHWVRVDLVDGSIVEGAVMKGLLYERPSAMGFIACRENEEEAGIRLWYSKGTLPWRFIPAARVKKIFTLKSFDQEELQALSVRWEEAKTASIQQSAADSSKAKAELMKREQAYLELIRRKDPPVSADEVKDTGHIIKGATLAVTLDSTGHNTFVVENPGSLSDPDLLAYFLGYRPEDKGRLIALKNSSGSLAKFSAKDKQFLALYDRWHKLYGSADSSTKASAK
ncbi:MAG: hypothetical protein AB7F75_08465 [Planctomycetota bacterium]